MTIELPKNCKFLLNYSKEDIINYISSEWLINSHINERSFLSNLWEIRSKEVQDKRSKLCDEGHHLVELARERDEYAKKFNDTTNDKLKLQYLKMMEPYGIAHKENVRKWKKLEEEQDDVDALYGKFMNIKIS